MLHQVQKNEIQKASIVLADAFQNDPLWNKIFEGETDLSRKFQICFETPLRLCLKYGQVFASSNNFEGVIAWTPGKFSHINMWRMIQSGAIFSGMRIGARVSKKMALAFGPMENDRKKYMQHKDYIYVYILGVSTAYQGKGYGGKLVRALIEMCDESKLAIYLETEIEQNVSFYEKFGFKSLAQITLPVVNHPMWEMLREPK